MKNDIEYSEIMEKIRRKKELSGLASPIVLEALEKQMKKLGIKKEFIKSLRKPEIKILMKETRAELRRYSGRFSSSKKEKNDLLEKNDINSLLKTHSSTKERLDEYEKIKTLIINLNVHSILDIGCGLNPLAIAGKNTEYYALDIKEDEIKIVNRFFKENNIKGRAFFYDIRKIERKELPKVDLCLIFKLFDVIEKNNHKIAEKIVQNIRCKYILISFPTKTLSGAPMNHPQRGWIERMLPRLHFSFSSFKTKNEIFYLVEKAIQKTT